MAFNPNEHLMKLKDKDYLEVKWRMVWFREQWPQGTIDTEEMCVDLDREVTAEKYVWNAEKRRNEKVLVTAKGYARFKAIVTDSKGGRATGTKSESAVDFPDFIEKAETGAIGRALAALGYGTQFAPEFDEAHRIVDSPVDPAPASSNGNGNATASARPSAVTSNSQATTSESDAKVTEEQLNSIRKLCTHMKKPVPTNLAGLTYLGAKNVIRELTAEYRELKAQASKSA